MIQIIVALLFIAGYAASDLEANDVRVEARNERGNSEEETRLDDIMHILQGACEREHSEQAIKQLKIDTQEILNNIGIYKEVVKMNTKLRSEIKWILDESNGPRERSRMISLLKRDVKDMCKPKLHPRDCTELNKVRSKSGVYMIYPNKVNGVKAYCDMDTDGGGWTVIQRRTDGTVKFERQWTEYENGFGDANGEHWFGNAYIHNLTTSAKYELRVDLEETKGQRTYAIYKTFMLGDAASQYQLTVHTYSGSAGNQLERNSSGKFSTRDRDNDGESRNLADKYGPWWFKSGSNTWLLDDQTANYWGKTIGRKTSMMIRKVK